MTWHSTLGSRLRSRSHAGIARSEWYRDQWLAAAAANGWTVAWDRPPFLDLERGPARLRVAGADTSLDSRVTYRIAGDKTVTEELLRERGLPTPETAEFDAARPTVVLGAIERLGQDAVVKPKSGTGGGVGVTVGPVGKRLSLNAIREAALFGRTLVVQRHRAGSVLRVLVLDGSVLDAVHRAPASVTGDGRADVRQLVAAENSRRASLGPLSTGPIPAGTDFRAALGRAGLTPRSVPPAGRLVVVAGRSNTGSELQSCRLELTEPARRMALDAAAAIGVRLAGVDLVVADDGSPEVVLEVNTGPGLHWHVLVAGEPFDPFGAILSA